MTRYVAKTGGKTYVVELSADRKKLKLQAQQHEVDFLRISQDIFSLILDSKSYEVYLRQGGKAVHVLVEGLSYDVVFETSRSRLLKTLPQQRVPDKSTLEVRAPMPGRVAGVKVTPGEEVEGGTGLIILEAMKMENEIRAPEKGKVLEVAVTKGSPVEKGDLLVRLGSLSPQEVPTGNPL